MMTRVDDIVATSAGFFFFVNQWMTFFGFFLIRFTAQGDASNRHL